MAAVPQQGLAHRGVYRHRVYRTGGCSATGSTGVFRPIAQGGDQNRVYRTGGVPPQVLPHGGVPAQRVNVYIYTYTCVYVFAIMFVNLKFGERASQSIMQPTWRPVTVTVWRRQMGGHPA